MFDSENKPKISAKHKQSAKRNVDVTFIQLSVLRNVQFKPFKVYFKRFKHSLSFFLLEETFLVLKKFYYCKYLKLKK